MCWSLSGLVLVVSEERRKRRNTGTKAGNNRLPPEAVRNPIEGNEEIVVIRLTIYCKLVVLHCLVLRTGKRDGAVTSHCLWVLPNVREGLTMPRLLVVVTPQQGCL